MDRQEKKRLEKEFGIAFLKSIGKFKEDLTTHDDNPDFLIQEEDILGIEITQVHNPTQTGELRVQVEGSLDRLLQNAKNIWDNKQLPAAHITLTFNPKFRISKTKSLAKAIEIVEFLSSYIPIEGEWYSSSNDMLIDVEGLTNFSIERIVKYDCSLWGFSDWIWAPILTCDMIQKALDKKERKRINYLNRCSRIWLVIVLYGGRASGAFEIPLYTINSAYAFNFDQVFLFDCLPGKHYELTRKKDVT